jgi:5'-methylthioadenosine phosphorylase/purine-nucleoside phosphorylase
MLGYTGTFNGEPISVQTTGMGCPSSAIVFEELVMLGATRMMRVGTCGAIKDGVSMGDTVIAISATATDETPLRYAQLESYAPACTFHLAETATRLSREQGTTVHLGPVVTSGLFYEPDKDSVARFKRVGHIAVEMEVAMLYTIAAVHDVEALGIMTVSDLLSESGHSKRISDVELREGVNKMMRLACEVVVS